jgi:hypothetical protein
MCAGGEWARELRPQSQSIGRVGGAGNSTVIRELGIKESTFAKCSTAYP